MFNFKQFLIDYNIPYANPGDRHYRKGWINIICPFCSGNQGNHLGYDPKADYFICHRCGWHSFTDIIKAITDKQDIKGIVAPYLTDNEKDVLSYASVNNNAVITLLPPEAELMQEQHKQYLISRNFDPDLLEKKWYLKGTNHLGDYRFRIIAPIYFNHQLVSYQGRDITGQQDLRYKACKIEDEVINHQNILYGFDEAIKNKSCLVVEGITGVWRHGFGSVSTFGAKVSKSQTRLLVKYFNRIFIMFDPDEAGQTNSDKLRTDLELMNKEVIIFDLPIEYDSGNLPQDDVDQIMREVLK